MCHRSGVLLLVLGALAPLFRCARSPCLSFCGRGDQVARSRHPVAGLACGEAWRSGAQRGCAVVAVAGSLRELGLAVPC